MDDENDKKDEKEKEKKWDIYGNRNKNYRDQRSIKASEKEKQKEVVKESKNIPNHVSSENVLLIAAVRSSEEQKDIDEKNEARLLKIARGRYKCSRCGALKVRVD